MPAPRPTARLEHFTGFLPRLAAATEAVLNFTGGTAVMTLDDRLAAPMQIGPEMASLNMGTMKLTLHPMPGRARTWHHDWARPVLEASEDPVFGNTPRDTAHILTTPGQGRSTRFEFECHDLSHLYMLRHFADRGMVTPPVFIQFVFGALGGMGPDAENLTHMVRIADKLFGGDHLFSVLAAGRHQMPLLVAAMGGHVRLGLEDSLTIGRGQLARSNAVQVARIRSVVETLGRRVMPPDEVRRVLGLKGATQVAL